MQLVVKVIQRKTSSNQMQPPRAWVWMLGTIQIIRNRKITSFTSQELSFGNFPSRFVHKIWNIICSQRDELIRTQTDRP